MVVVTDFELKEHEELICDKVKDEWLRLAQEAGMTSLVEKKESRNVAFGYPTLTNEMKNAFKLLLPTQSTLERYEYDIPPIEALGLISRAKLSGEFDSIVICYRDASSDPIAIGVKGKEQYLIVAWGPEKVSEEKILERFRAEVRRRLIAKWAEVKHDWETALAAPDSYADQYLARGWFYGNVNL